MHIARINDPSIENLDEIFGIPSHIALQWRDIRSKLIYEALFKPESPIQSDADALESFIQALPDHTTPQQAAIAAFIFSKHLTLETQRIRQIQMQQALHDQIINQTRRK